MPITPPYRLRPALRGGLKVGGTVVNLPYPAQTETQLLLGGVRVGGLVSAGLDLQGGIRVGGSLSSDRTGDKLIGGIRVGGLLAVSVGAAGGGAIAVLDEGTELTAQATALDFVGAGVAVTESGGVATVTIPGGGLPVRATASVTTASIANGAIDNVTATLAKVFTLLRIATNVPARVRLYSTPAYRSSDASRSLGTDPSGEHGLICEVATTATNLVLDLSPMPTGASLEATPTSDIAVAITNLSGTTQAVTADFVYLPGES